MAWYAGFQGFRSSAPGLVCFCDALDRCDPLHRLVRGYNMRAQLKPDLLRRVHTGSSN